MRPARGSRPTDVVEQMVICYNAQRLAYQHLHETNALMAQVVPELEQRSVLETAVRIYNRMARFQREHGVDRLMTIAEDGQIDQSERAEFDAIMADLRGRSSRAVWSWRYSADGTSPEQQNPRPGRGEEG